MNCARLDRCLQCAVGFALMRTVPKFTLPCERPQFNKAIENLLRAYMPKPELADTGGVDQIEAGKVKQSRRGCSVHALVVHSRQPTHRRERLVDTECIYK